MNRLASFFLGVGAGIAILASAQDAARWHNQRAVLDDNPYGLNIESNAPVYSGNGLAATRVFRLDFPAIRPGACEDMAVLADGAYPGQSITKGFPSAVIGRDLIADAWISSPNAVTVRLCNASKRTIDLPVLSFEIGFWR